MPRCLILTPFPTALPRHGGQVRAASIGHALRLAGWHVDMAGLFHAALFPSAEWGVLDIVTTDPAAGQRALDDLLFADLHVARHAASDPQAIDALRTLLARLRPDVVLVEHPWSWLPLRVALPEGGGPRVVYSSQNIEWSARQPLFRLGLKRPGGDALVEATRLLEAEFARAADLVLAISDLEAVIIERECGREVAYLPPTSDLAEGQPPVHAAFSRAARERPCRYAALMGSAYWPNVEGFFDTFGDGLGFLAPDEQVWVAGTLGPALQSDPRWDDVRSLNDSRAQIWGYVDDADKASFFAAASCVILPVLVGAGSKLKTADALASLGPLITTPHAIEGYGPLVADALGRGVYVAETPRAFRDLLRQGLRGGLMTGDPALRERVSPRRMASTLAPLLAGLLR